MIRPLLLALGMTCTLAAADPAGRTWVVAQGHPQADDAGPATADRPLRTISAAAAQAGPGDTVLIHRGIYRERVAPARGGTPGLPITYRAAPGEAVALRGSDAWTPAWAPVPGRPGLRRAALPADLATAGSPYRTGLATGSKDRGLTARPLDGLDPATAAWRQQAGEDRRPRTLGLLVVDGEPLRELDSASALERVPGTWMVDDAGDGLLVNPPAGEPLERRLVELGVRAQVFAPARRGVDHLVLEGLVIEHAVNQGPFPQIGMVGTRSGRGWTISGCTIRHAKTIGLDIGSEHWAADALPAWTAPEDRRPITGGGHRIIGNRVLGNGLCGIAGLRSPDTVIAGNLVEGSNALGLHSGLTHGIGWWEQAGIKLHLADRVRIEGNVVRGSDGFGIWIDNGFTGARITRNVVVGNRLGGICLEMGHGPALVDRNLVALTDGEGFYAHDSSNVTLAHNLLLQNAGCGAWMHTVTRRKADGRPVATTGNRLLNNLIIGNRRGSICLPPPDAPGCADNRSEGNALLDGAWLDVFCQPALRLNGNDGAIDLGDGIGVSASKAPRQDSRPYDLEAWRRLTGWDRTSLDLDRPRMRLLFRPIDLTLEWVVPPELAAMAVEPVPGVERDLLGRPWPASGPRPGPFADLPAGLFHHVFHPVTTAE